MKIVHFTFRRFFSCFSFFITFIKKILFRGRQRKSSQGDKDSIPTSVTVSRDQQLEGEEQWEEWEQMEEFSVKVEPASDPQQDPAEEDLFHDMTPVFQKPKKIVLKKNKGYPDGGYNTRPETTPSRFNFDMSYSPVEPELGTWNDESTSVWDEEAVSEKDIEWETEKLVKERKQAERERRTLEQQRRREEREALKHMDKKTQGHLGVRLST